VTARADPLRHVARLCLGLAAALTVDPVFGWLPAFLLTGLLLPWGTPKAAPHGPKAREGRLVARVGQVANAGPAGGAGAAGAGAAGVLVAAGASG